MNNILTNQQLGQWKSAGALWPVDLLSQEETIRFRDKYLALEAATNGGAQGRFRMKAHLPVPWMWELIRLPRLADAIEDLVGPDIVCWGSSFFAKSAHDPRVISWHQASVYYGIDPPDSITAWIALTDATTLSGCMRIIPGSHISTQFVQHEETRAPNNMLSRGQTIRDVNESLAVEMPLVAGQMSIHHNKTFHASEPNQADWPRIGVAIHFAASHLRQVNFDGATAIPVRGNPRHWLPEPYPDSEMSPASLKALEDFLAAYRSSGRKQH